MQLGVIDDKLNLEIPDNRRLTSLGFLLRHYSTHAAATKCNNDAATTAFAPFGKL